MSELTNPTDIARETLRLLASRRIAPTPDNYLQHYQEIAGLPNGADPTEPERMLQQLAADLRARPGTASSAGALEGALGRKDWKQSRLVIWNLLEDGLQTGAAPAWGQIVRDLIRQWEARHPHFTSARKRESLDKILASSGDDATLLAGRLQGLLKSWSQTLSTPPDAAVAATGATGLEATAAAAPAPQATAAAATARAAPPAGDADLAGQLRELLAQTLEVAVMSQLGHAPDLAEEANSLAQLVRAACGKAALARLAASVRQFCFRLETRGGGQAELHQGLLRLLRLLIDNTHELLSEDQWLRGQVAMLRELVSRPMDLDTIAEAERRLKEVLFKQGVLRNSLQEAKAALREMVTRFIDRLGELSESTGGYHARLEAYAQTIRRTDDIRELNTVLSDLLRDTREAQVVTTRTRDELLAARQQVEVAEEKIRTLERDLEQVSGLVREDQLTGVLNRRGLDDAYRRETARSQRTGTPLCVALLDIDNFKQLNDAHGHQTGDDALLHLVRVIKRTMRPSDVIARFGGEEFVLLLPETSLEEAVAVMARLQRNLTKTFFMHDNERLLITFSAGVALRLAGEDQAAVVERADKALYRAKRAGKNRVLAAQ